MIQRKRRRLDVSASLPLPLTSTRFSRTCVSELPFCDDVCVVTTLLFSIGLRNTILGAVLGAWLASIQVNVECALRGVINFGYVIPSSKDECSCSISRHEGSRRRCGAAKLRTMLQTLDCRASTLRNQFLAKLFRDAEDNRLRKHLILPLAY